MTHQLLEGISLAVFDVAGTTINDDNAVYSALERAIRAANMWTTPETIARAAGMSKREAIRQLAADNDITLDRDGIEEVHESFRDHLQALYEISPPRPIPGVEDFLQQLGQDGIRTALTTGFDRDLTEVILTPLHWENNLVDAVITADDVEQGRPAPFMIFRAMETTGILNVETVLVAGDTVADVCAGNNAGAGQVIGVLTGHGTRPALSAIPKTTVITSLAELHV